MYNFYEVHQYELDIVNHHRALKWGSHLHNEFEIMYIFDGEQGIVVNERKYILKKGDCAVIFPNIIHSYTRPDDIPKYNTNADSAVIFMPAASIYSMYPDIHGQYPAQCIIRSENMHSNTVLAFDKIFGESNINAQIGWAYIIFAHTIPIVKVNNISSNENTDIVSRILSYIALNFKESLTLESIADALNINKFTVSRIFSQKIKMNFRTYIGTLRANHAASLIKISDNNLEDIAEASGFESIRSFYRVFREVFNVSPAQYRNMIRRHKT